MSSTDNDRCVNAVLSSLKTHTYEDAFFELELED